jgi:exodeoxyribonuclease V alpha subunit
MQFAGCGFNRCDQLRIKLGLPAYMPERYDAAATQVFKDKSSETWIQKDVFLADAANFLQADSGVVRTCINNRVRDGAITYRQGYLASPEAARLEEQVCRLLIEKSHTSELAIIPNLYGKGITTHQATELHTAFENGGIAFLLGSAGTGKTSSAAAVMKQYKRVIACAPTGKAAQRMGYFLRELGLDGIIPTTIHRLLKASPAGGNWIFGVDGISEQIDADLLVVDECSMLDNFLAASLLKAVSPRTLILMLGDTSQLPPVGRGTMLRDWEAWCAANPRYTYGRLTEIHRNAGEIAAVCKGIREKKLPFLDPVSWPLVTDNPANNLQLVHVADDEVAQEELLCFVADLQSRGIDLKQDFQVITATNAGSLISKDELNQVLKKQINPGAAGTHAVFKVGDRVMCTSNSFFHTADSRGQQIAGEKHYVANGEIGFVVRSLEKRIVVAMEANPAIQLYVPCGAAGVGFDLGYACTTHKFQGSQATIVAVMLSGEYKAQMVTGCEWIYTALSRAQDLCVLFSKNDILRDACRQIRIWDRKSFMMDWFKKYGKMPICDSR